MIALKGIILCAIAYSSVNDINLETTLAVIKIESNFNEKAIGKDGKDIGLMQIRKPFVKETKKELLNGCTNIKVGTQKLAEAKKNCRHKVDDTWIVCYNRGIRGGSLVKEPKKDEYFKKFKKKKTRYYAALNLENKF